MKLIEYLEYKTIVEKDIYSNNKFCIVDNISDLETIPSNYTTALVQDSQRGGIFNWTSTGTVDNGIIFSGLTGYWKRNFIYPINVKMFGAIGNGIADDSTIIQSVIDYFYDMGGGCVNFPEGNFKIETGVILKNNVRLNGVHRTASSITGINTISCIKINGYNTEISNLKIGWGAVGVETTADSCYYGKIKDCHITYNRIGLLLPETYIFEVSSNIINLNGYGLIAPNESFELLIINNVIDNNTSGAGIILIGTTGAVVSNNTIEGNRNTEQNNKGVGLIAWGLSQCLTIDTNWFELNGNHATNACDVILGIANTSEIADIISNCIPAEYQPVGAQIITGNVPIKNNHFSFTKHAIYVNAEFSTMSIINIDNNSYVGTGSLNNIPTYIYGSSAYDSFKVDIRNQTLINTADPDINAEMLLGIKNSTVYHGGTVPDIDKQIMLDNEDLFTVSMTVKEFSVLTGATLDCIFNYATSGYSKAYYDCKEIQGVKGFTTEEKTGKTRIGETDPLATDSHQYAIVLSSQSASVMWHTSGGYPSNDCCYNNIQNIFNIIDLETPSSAYFWAVSGSYYGHCIMSESYYNNTFRGATKIKLTDMKIVPLKITASSIPNDARFYADAGDILYNSAPAPAGYLGWVVTTSGAPGTWKGFGLIESE